ncbi:Mitochondrial import inner membrane translocase subunit TIM16 [Intoshia linei]|uniref:Mitochondrial import inner membrane translocase subunit TIM16 n=1 Tax=Intoshia linei TaxID=1819745 RepID=A0A177BE94_9BILA|nr:Mitochondrial import inner membrane translocase subunit TIM16 [Intoshia linei]
MVARYLINIVLSGTRIIASAFGKAVRSEYDASRNAAKTRANINKNTKTESIFYNDITLNESKNILSIKDENNLEEINARFKYLYDINEKSKGGTFYLQSKIYRAHEFLVDNYSNQKSTKPENSKD